MKKEINLLNEKFKGSVIFQEGEFRVIDNTEVIEHLREITVELNHLDYDYAEDKFLYQILHEFNDIMRMKRLDMKTEWAIIKVREMYKYMIKNEII